MTARIERIGEGLARRVDRRRFLRRSAGAVFGFAAAWSVHGFGAPGALAGYCDYFSSSCYCSPPGYGYCSSSDYCNGSYCNTAYCSYDTSDWPGGCWCTQGCDFGQGSCGYYRCCDCDCPDGFCGCSAFTNTWPECPYRPAK